MNNLKGVNKDKFFRLNYRKSRGNSRKIIKFRPRLEVRKYSFGNRVVNAWNSLPDEAVVAPSVNIFKGFADKFVKFWGTDISS